MPRRETNETVKSGEPVTHGLLGLRFSRYAEEQFRQHYATLNQPKVRPLLMMTAVIVIGAVGLGMAGHSISASTAIYGLAVMMPLLLATLFASYHPERYDLYQPLLAASLIAVGLIVTSLSLRASLHGTPYFFAAIVAWLFVVWITVGLLMTYAAGTTTLVSTAYAWGLLQWNFGYQEALFEIVMLVGVNAVGALCCYQFESVTRQAFRDRGILEDMAARDGLTGLYNRRAYNDYMERIFRQIHRENGHVTILLVDIDYFKSYNDFYGHQAGDDALRRVAEVISMGAQRPLDLAARYGGEEFALVLYCPAAEFGRDLPDHLRRKVEALNIINAESRVSKFLTVSIGVAILAPGDDRSLPSAVQLADEALYQAKEGGRNRVVIKESNAVESETGRFRIPKRAVG